MPPRDANIAELKPQSPQPTTNPDWSGWDRCLRGHLDRELGALHSALGQLLAEERQKIDDRFERKTSEFEVKIAKLSGAVDVLRGAQPPPPAQFPRVKAFNADTIYYEGDIVAFAGSCWQAQRDTAQAPGMADWTCLAKAGRDGESFIVRGTFDATAEYRRLDVVALNGGCFIARKDAPGPCPGSGWQLLGGQGRGGGGGGRGERGRAGLSGATIRD